MLHDKQNFYNCCVGRLSEASLLNSINDIETPTPLRGTPFKRGRRNFADVSFMSMDNCTLLVVPTRLLLTRSHRNLVENRGKCLFGMPANPYNLE